MIQTKTFEIGKLKYKSNQIVLRYERSKKPHQKGHILIMFFQGTSTNIHGKINYQCPKNPIKMYDVSLIRLRKENSSVRGVCSNNPHKVIDAYHIHFNKRAIKNSNA